jgi:hypothetical protein
LQPGVDHRRRFVDSAADTADDPVDDDHEMSVIAELDIHLR